MVQAKIPTLQIRLMKEIIRGTQTIWNGYYNENQKAYISHHVSPCNSTIVCTLSNKTYIGILK